MVTLAYIHDMGKTLEDLLRSGQHDEALQRVQAGELDPSSALSGIHHAAGLENPELLRRLLAAGADPNHPSRPLPIEAAVSDGRLANVEMLLAAGADPNTGHVLMTAIEGRRDEIGACLVAGDARPGTHGESPLAQAVWHDLPVTLRAMIDAGYDIDDRATFEPEAAAWVYENAPAVVVAAGEGHQSLLELLVTAGANLAAADDGGVTAWAAAERAGHPELARWIESVGGPRELVLSATEVLLQAAAKGDVEAARQALADGADANVRDQRKRTLGRTPLLLAILGAAEADHGAADMVQLLLEKGADPDLRDRLEGDKAHGVFGQAATPEVFKFPHVVYGHTPLALAAVFGRIDCAEILIKAGADATSVDDLGYACVDQAVINNQAEMLRLLLASGVDPAHQGPAGPLLVQAAADGDFACLSLLLQAGADANSSHNEETALHKAAMAQDGESILALLDAGADPNRRNGDGDTALQLALEYGETEGEDASPDEDENEDAPLDEKVLERLSAVTTVAPKLPGDDDEDDDEDWDESWDNDEDEIPELEMPELAVSLQVHYAWRAARARLAAAALTPEVRAVADELAERCGAEPQEMADGQGFSIHVHAASSLAREPLNIEALQAEYGPQGALILGNGSVHHKNRLFVVPTTDPLEAIAAIGCAGPSHDITSGQVIEFFRSHPAVITDLRSDTVVGRFNPLPANLRQLAIEVSSLCPDTIYRGAGSFDALMLSLAEGTFHLRWE